MFKLLKRLNLESLLKFGGAAILIAIPLYPKFPFIRVPGTFVSVRIEDFLIFTVSFLWLIFILPHLREFSKDKLNKAFLFFLTACLFSLTSGIWVTKTIVLHIGILHFLRRIEYFLPFFIASAAVRKEEDLAFYIKLLILILFFTFSYGMGQKYFDWPIVTTQDFESAKGIALSYTPGAHLSATFAGHYDLASFLILILPLMFVLLLGKTAIKGSRTKLISFLAILAGFWLLVNSISRISFVSYLIGASLALFMIRKIRWIPLVLVISLIFAGSSADLVARYSRIIEVTVKKIMFTPQEVMARDLSTGRQETVFEDRSTSIRFNIEWPRALRAFSKNPLLGTGLSSITLATDNDYLRLLGELGLFGFLAFILIFIRLLSKLSEVFPIPLKLKLSQAYVVAITAALPGVFLNALFIDIFEASKFAIIFWFLMGMAYASVNLAKKVS